MSVELYMRGLSTCIILRGGKGDYNHIRPILFEHRCALYHDTSLNSSLGPKVFGALDKHAHHRTQLFKARGSLGYKSNNIQNSSKMKGRLYTKFQSIAWCIALVDIAIRQDNFLNSLPC